MIDSDDIESLPDDPEAAFVRFHNICRETLTGRLHNLGRDDDATDDYIEFMARVEAAAQELEITGADALRVPISANFSYSDYKEFAQRAL